MYSFKNGFKRARKKAGYTQESFCESFTDSDGCKISLPTVRNWEQGRTVPEWKIVESLCVFFGCDMDYLFANMERKNHDKEFICQKTGLSENAVNTLMLMNEKSRRQKAAVLDQLILHPWVLDTINCYFEVSQIDEISFLKDGGPHVSEERHGIAILINSKSGKGISIPAADLSEAIMPKIQKQLSDIRDELQTQK